VGILKEKSNQDMLNELQGLIEIREILNVQNISWFLSGGALLGAVRANDFIKWDWDVGIFLLSEEFETREYFLAQFFKKGFHLIKEDLSNLNRKFVINKYGVDYELLFWKKKNTFRVRKNMKRPSRFVENGFDIVAIRGESFRAPKPPIEYLEFVYGPYWRTPLKTNDKSVYFSKKNSRYHLSNAIRKFLPKSLKKYLKSVLDKLKNF